MGNFTTQKMKFFIKNHCVKSVRIRRFSGPYFLAFGLNTENYEASFVFSPNEGKYGPENLRIRTFFTQWIYFYVKCLVFV